MNTGKRVALGIAAIPAVLMLVAGSALAHECVNASKVNQAAGVQVVIDDESGEVVWATRGVLNRIAQGIINPETGEGFSGLIGFDVNGDQVADLATWIVGPNGEIPQQAQYGGATCSGVVNIEVWFEQCQTDPV
ncbi:hypothetical protein GCM10027417_05850 [Glutamicibacter endophyticus]